MTCPQESKWLSSNKVIGRIHVVAKDLAYYQTSPRVGYSAWFGPLVNVQQPIINETRHIWIALDSGGFVA